MSEADTRETPVEVREIAWHSREFPEAAKDLLEQTQMRRNVRHATNVIQKDRKSVV